MNANEIMAELPKLKREDLEWLEARLHQLLNRPQPGEKRRGCEPLLNLSPVRRLTGEQEGLDELSFAAGDHSGKPLEPFSAGNFRLCGQPVSQQPKLINRNVAAFDTLQQVRP